MSILIRGMEMPKDGVYWCEIGVADDIAMITIHGEDRKSFHLVPVPPHGRLIESKAFLQVVHKTDNFSLDELAHLAVLVAATPTIIPAEEGET